MKTQVTRGLTVALVLLGVMIWMPPETEAQGLIRLSAEFQNFDDTESATNLVVPGSVVYRKPIVVGDRHDYLVRLTAALVLLGVMIVVAAQATAMITTSTTNGASISLAATARRFPLRALTPLTSGWLRRTAGWCSLRRPTST